MKIEEVRNLLQKTEGFRLLFLGNHDQMLVFNTNDSSLISLELNLLRTNFLDNGLEAWVNDHRVVVTKVYESYTYFYESWKDDQITISNLLNFVPLQYKNNLYFLIVLEFDNEDGIYNELLMEKNKAEKNSKYCRKYILQDKDDLERLPFSRDIEKQKTDSFSYEQKFIDMLVTNSQDFDHNIVELIKDYFKPDMRLLLNDKSKLKMVIEKRFGGESNHEITPDEH